MSKKRNEENANEVRAVWKLAGYVFATVLASGLMLGFNAGLVFALFHGIEGHIPGFQGLQNVVQFVIFVAPVLLLILEWYAWDIISSRPVSNK